MPDDQNRELQRKAAEKSPDVKPMPEPAMGRVNLDALASDLALEWCWLPESTPFALISG